MEIVDDGAATQVKEVLAAPTIAGAPPLPVTDMRQGMFDGDALPELGASSGRELALAPFSQEAFIGVKMDTAPARTGRTARAEGTGSTGGGREVDSAAWGDGVKGSSTWAGQRIRWHGQSRVKAVLG
jgi:hypothetical protein